MEEKLNVEKLQKKLEEVETKNKEYLEGWKKERADFLNYKKEEMERISSFIKYANEELLLKFLPVLDNFYIAEKELCDEIKNHKWIEGFLNIKNQISEFLKSQGVQEIKTVGESFDPNFHEAVGEVEKTEVIKKEGERGEAKSGVIIEEIKKGYTLNGKVIRPAKVKIIK